MADAEATLLLIRHGETVWNAQSRIQGHMDIALSERGLHQAQLLARFLGGSAIDAVYASDLARASQTAQPLADARALALHVDARLRERAFGLFEGSTYEEIQAKWPNEFAIWRRREAAYAVPGGESYLAQRARVLQFLEEVAGRHAGATVAVVTHGGVLDIVYRAAYGIAWETPRSHLLPNASISRVLARNPGPALTVCSWAERQHLDEPIDEVS
ncbi:MAG TPA: histidine phosphatase family protein [Burkholderiaceae bacterium]|nr:histidine phosphatase family protein [Burkholderiaceae bacterium]